MISTTDPLLPGGQKEIDVNDTDHDAPAPAEILCPTRGPWGLSEHRNHIEVRSSIAARSFDSRPDHWAYIRPLSDADELSLATPGVSAESIHADGKATRNSRRIFDALIREARRERHFRRH